MPNTATKFTQHDIVEFVTLPAGRTYEVTELAPDAGTDPDPMVRIWPTDPADTRHGQWISSSLLRHAQHCPDHCPRCGMDLKSEGYPQGHQTDDGDVCEWSWDLRQAISDDLNR